MTAEIKPKSKSGLCGFVPELRKVRAISWPREGLHTVLIWFLMSAAKQSWNLIHLQPQVMSRLEFQRCAHEISLYKPQADGLEVKVMSFYILIIVCILCMGKKYHFSINLCASSPRVQLLQRISLWFWGAQIGKRLWLLPHMTDLYRGSPGTPYRNKMLQRGRYLWSSFRRLINFQNMDELQVK